MSPERMRRSPTRPVVARAGAFCCRSRRHSKSFDDWQVIGLAGTGSKLLRGDPPHRRRDRAHRKGAHRADPAHPGRARSSFRHSLCAGATDRLSRAAGWQVLFEGNELQRGRSDVQAVASRTTGWVPSPVPPARPRSKVGSVCRPERQDCTDKNLTANGPWLHRPFLLSDDRSGARTGSSVGQGVGPF